MNDPTPRQEGYRAFVKELAAGEFHPQKVTRLMMLAVVESVIEATDGSLDNIKKDIFYGRSDHDFPEYAAFDPDFTEREWDLFHALMGMITEAGELAIVLRDMIQGRSIDETNLVEELGDVRFYQELAYDALGTDEEAVVRTNVRKLLKRYKGGTFSQDEALNRDTSEEIKAMEESDE